jgi:hypothetical protein
MLSVLPRCMLPVLSKFNLPVGNHPQLRRGGVQYSREKGQGQILLRGK